MTNDEINSRRISPTFIVADRSQADTHYRSYVCDMRMKKLRREGEESLTVAHLQAMTPEQRIEYMAELEGIIYRCENASWKPMINSMTLFVAGSALAISLVSPIPYSSSIGWIAVALLLCIAIGGLLAQFIHGDVARDGRIATERLARCQRVHELMAARDAR